MAQFDQAAFLKGRADLRDYESKREKWAEKSVRSEQLDAQLRSLGVQKASVAADVARLQTRQKSNNDRIQELQARIQAAEPSGPNPPVVLSPADRASIEEELKKRKADRTTLEESIADRSADSASLDAQIAAKNQEKSSLGDLSPPSFPTVSTPSPSGDQSAQQGTQSGSDNGGSSPLQQAVAKRLGEIVGGDPRQTLFQILENLTDGELQLLSRKLTLGKGSSDPYYQLYFMELSSTVLPGPENQGQLARVRWKIDPCTLQSGTKNNFQIQATIENDTRTPFIYELTPIRSQVLIAGSSVRQASRDINAKAGLFGWMFGVRASKDRQTGRQSLERDVLVAGAGKGLAEFGWDIMPQSSDEFVTPGVYTAFAILAVPDTCGTSLSMARNEGWLDLKEKVAIKSQQRGGPPQGTNLSDVFTPTAWKTFEGYETRIADRLGQANRSIIDLPVLSDRSGKVSPITALSYVSARPGGMATVTLEGPLFSEETKVLVGGTPLYSRQLSDGAMPQNAGANPAPSNSSGEFPGSFEVPSSKLLIMRFQCPAQYTGSPSIVLYSPSFSALDIRSLKLNNRTITSRDEQRMKVDAITGNVVTSFEQLEEWYRSGGPLGDVLCRAREEEKVVLTMKAVNRRLGKPLVSSPGPFPSEVNQELIDVVITAQGLSDQQLAQTQIILNPAGSRRCQWSCFGGACVQARDAQYTYNDLTSDVFAARSISPYSILPVPADGTRRFAARAKIERVPTACGLEVLLRSPASSGGATIGAVTKDVVPTPSVDVSSIQVKRSGERIEVSLQGVFLSSVRELASKEVEGLSWDQQNEGILTIKGKLKGKLPEGGLVDIMVLSRPDEVDEPPRSVIWQVRVPAQPKPNGNSDQRKAVAKASEAVRR